MAERNRELMKQRLQGDPRLDGAEVVAATPLMRVSIFVAVFAGVAGAVVGQVFLGEGGLQFGLGMLAGYLAYWAYLRRTMGEPRVIGAMAALTRKKIVLLGSRRAGVVAEYDIADLDGLEIVRKGNLVFMGKLAITPNEGDQIMFMTTNRHLAAAFVEAFEELRRRDYSG